MIDTVYHLWVKKNKGQGREGLKERGSLLTFFPWKRGGGLLERESLIEDLRYVRLR